MNANQIIMKLQYEMNRLGKIANTIARLIHEYGISS
jgi:hypothetical protein